MREGITAAGGVAFEFPCHPIQETGKRPTASLDRNLAYLSLVEVLYGYPLDGVVLLTGCDKTMPACLMAAATVNIPTISLNVGPMLNGWSRGERTGSGTVVWKARERHAAGDIDYQQFLDIVASSAPSDGHCNTMGTASTMNALAEALGMALPGSAAIPAPYRERGQAAYATGQRIVDMVWEDLKPSDILTREAFENAIVANTAIGGSTNAPIHINAIAKLIGVPLSCDDWERVGYDIPLLVNMQPAGQYLGEEYYRAGGLPAVMSELLEAGKLHADVLTCNGKTVAENCAGAHTWDRDVIKPYGEPMRERAGFLNLKGSLFDSAIMKTSVISREFYDRYLANPTTPTLRGACRGVRRAGGLPPPHRRSGARDRRAHGADHARRRADRLSGRGRGGEHAAPGRADPPRRAVVALHRRRAPVRHLGHALDPQRLAGGGGRRRPRPAPERRPVRIDLNKRTADILLPRRRSGAAATTSTPGAATPTRRARPPGRRSSARWSTSSPRA